MVRARNRQNSHCCCNTATDCLRKKAGAKKNTVYIFLGKDHVKQCKGSTVHSSPILDAALTSSTLTAVRRVESKRSPQSQGWSGQASEARWKNCIAFIMIQRLAFREALPMMADAELSATWHSNLEIDFWDRNGTRAYVLGFVAAVSRSAEGNGARRVLTDLLHLSLSIYSINPSQIHGSHTPGHQLSKTKRENNEPPLLQLSGCQALMAGKEGPSQSFNDKQGWLVNCRYDHTFFGQKIGPECPVKICSRAIGSTFSGQGDKQAPDRVSKLRGGLMLGRPGHKQGQKIELRGRSKPLDHVWMKKWTWCRLSLLSNNS